MSTEDGVRESERKQAEADRKAGINRNPHAEVPVNSSEPKSPNPEEVRGLGGNAPLSEEQVEANDNAGVPMEGEPGHENVITETPEDSKTDPA